MARKTKEQLVREAVAKEILQWCEDVQKANGETPLGLCQNCRPYAVIALEGYEYDKFFKEQSEQEEGSTV